MRGVFARLYLLLGRNFREPLQSAAEAQNTATRASWQQTSIAAALAIADLTILLNYGRNPGVRCLWRSTQ